jgi:hypothetical protein
LRVIPGLRFKVAIIFTIALLLSKLPELGSFRLV